MDNKEVNMDNEVKNKMREQVEGGFALPGVIRELESARNGLNENDLATLLSNDTFLLNLFANQNQIGKDLRPTDSQVRNIIASAGTDLSQITPCELFKQYVAHVFDEIKGKTAILLGDSDRTIVDAMKKMDLGKYAPLMLFLRTQELKPSADGFVDRAGTFFHQVATSILGHKITTHLQGLARENGYDNPVAKAYPELIADPTLASDVVIGLNSHDLYKFALARLTNKNGRLTPAEREIMNSHAEFSAQLIEASGYAMPKRALEIVRYHHEKPHPALHVKVATVADIYDALTSPRPYKEAFDPHTALSIMTKSMEAGELDTIVMASLVQLHRQDRSDPLKTGFCSAPPALEDRQGYGGRVTVN